MRRAGGDVVALVAERADRTGAETRALTASVAGARGRRDRWNLKRLGKAERAAIGMPKPIDRVNENADRRKMHGLGAARPLLKRPMRRPAERIERRRAELSR